MSTEQVNHHTNKGPARYWVLLLLAGMTPILMSTNVRHFVQGLSNGQLAALLVAFITSAVIAERKQRLLSAALYLCIGALVLIKVMPQLQRESTPEIEPGSITAASEEAHEHHELPSAAAANRDSIDSKTKFSFVLVFPQDVATEQIEAFRETVVKRVHVHACVRNLPCVARLLRLFEVGQQRAQVLAFDLMAETSIAERTALTTAIQAHPLKPGVYFNQSPEQATQ